MLELFALGSPPPWQMKQMKSAPRWSSECGSMSLQTLAWETYTEANEKLGKPWSQLEPLEEKHGRLPSPFLYQEGWKERKGVQRVAWTKVFVSLWGWCIFEERNQSRYDRPYEKSNKKFRSASTFNHWRKKFPSEKGMTEVLICS